LISVFFPEACSEGRSLVLSLLPCVRLEGKSLDFSLLPWGEIGGKKPCFQSFSRREEALSKDKVSLPSLRSTVTGERKGGYAFAAYPSLPLTVTKTTMTQLTKMWRCKVVENTLTITTGGRTVTTTLEGLERAAESLDRVAEPIAPDDEGKFSEAPEVQLIAARLISREEHFGHLAEARISYLFRFGSWTSKGLIVMGKAYVMDERQRFNTDIDLQVIINQQVWECADETQREALVAHELCHFEKDIDNQGRPRYALVNHDLEEFRYMVKCYGAWDDSLRKFLDAYQAGEEERHQLSLFEEGQTS